MAEGGMRTSLQVVKVGDGWEERWCQKWEREIICFVWYVAARRINYRPAE